MRIQIHKEGKLIADATLPDTKENYEILRRIVDNNLKIEKELGEIKEYTE